MTHPAQRRPGGGAARQQVDETRAESSTPAGYVVNPEPPDKTEAELLAYADGWLAGYERGQADGYAAGFATADTILKGAVAAALGRPGDDFSTAVKRANRNLAVVQYRRQQEAA